MSTTEERVLCVTDELFRDLFGADFQGFSPDVYKCLPVLLDERYWRVIVKSQAEQDPSFKQLIPYIVITHRGNIFCYQRQKGGEKRLDAKKSIGIGGHINDDDEDFFSGMLRELTEEVKIGDWTYQQIADHLRPIGFIYDNSNDVGKVHLGIVHVLALPDNFTDFAVREADRMVETAWLSYDMICKEHERLEGWSKILILSDVASSQILSVRPEPVHDEVNHPKHYNQGSIECLDAIESALGKEQFVGFLRGTIIKYMWRCPFKANLHQDCCKAAFYLNRLIQTVDPEKPA